MPALRETVVPRPTSDDRRLPEASPVEPSLKSSIHVLVVDDDQALREGCASFFQAEGYSVTMCGSGHEALERVRRRRYDLIFLDVYMSQVPGIEILKAALEAHKDTLVIMMTGNPSVESNLEALRSGAWDYLLKPFTPAHLDVVIGRAAHAIFAARGARHQADRVRDEVGNSDLVTCIGVSPAFRQAVELARKVALTDASVMLSGESGTGKEVIAQVIHRHSYRANKQMVPINCAALPENLLESEMFGHRKGAFTGADRDKPGLLEVANGGTLFLDELTEMSQRLQAKLLRVLQDGIVRRVGSERQDAAVDVRFISATNHEPREAVKKGILRADLFYRLRVVMIQLPPLRERVEDIPLLANHFLAHYWSRYRRTQLPAPTFADETMDLLKSRSWPGNVRELQNVIEHIAVLAQPNKPVCPGDVPFYEDFVATGSVEDTFPTALMEQGYYAARDKLLADFERVYLTRLVNRAGGNMSKAARMASIDRSSLYRLIRRHGMATGELAESRAE